MSDTIQYIPLDQIQPHPANRRVGGFDEAKLQQLADSIRSVGVQQPAVVRKVLSPTGDYQLVTGERRWRAAKLAGLEALPCIVRAIDDAEALRIQVIENVQREDVHPLDEADGYAALLNGGRLSVEEVGAAVGKSASYVYQRLKLADLVPSARKLLIDGTITAGHAILVARLPAAAQEELAEHELSYEDVSLSVRQLSDYIQREILRELSHVPWKLDDEELPGGSCTACPKRAGFEPALFADVCTGKKDYCTDRACFVAKRAAFVDRRRKDLAEDGPVLEVSDQYYSPEKGVVAKGNWEECKKSEEGAQRVLIVDGENVGRATWGRKIARGTIGGGIAETPEERARREHDAFQRKLEAATDDRLKDRVRTAMLTGTPPADPRELLRLAAKNILADWSSRDAPGLYGWDTPKQRDKAIEAMDESELARAILLARTFAQNVFASDVDIVAEAAKLLGIDVKALRREVAAEIQPKKHKKSA